MSGQQRKCERRKVVLKGKIPVRRNIDSTLKKQEPSPDLMVCESLCEYITTVPGGVPSNLSERLESFGYNLTLEEEEKLYAIYKRVARRMFNERYGN